MARDRLNIGSRWKRRAFIGFATIISATGCRSTDREDSFSNLDARTRQMLLAPVGGAVKAPQQQYAIVNPAATGATGLNRNNSFDRGMMGAQPSYAAQNTGNTQYTGVVPPGTGVMQTGFNTPTMPTTGGNITLQPNVQHAYATTPAPVNNGPPVLPTQPVTQVPVSIIATMMPPGMAPLVPPITPTQSSSEFTPPALPVAIVSPPPAMPSVPEVVAPTAPETPKLNSGMTTLPSPVDQPPTGFGPLAPAPLIK